MKYPLLTFLFFVNSNFIRAQEIGITKIFVLGNSITSHAPVPSIGWFGDWGMAASSANSDYMAHLKKSVPTEVEIELLGRNSLGTVSGFDFERNFSTINPEDYLESVRNWSPDLIIVAYGENIPSGHDKIDSLFFHLNRVVEYLQNDRTDIKVCIKNNFWPETEGNKIINEQIKKASEEFGWLLADISDLQTSQSPNACQRFPSENNAVGIFSNCGVALHPSDLGMKRIFEAIWEQVGCMFDKCMTRVSIQQSCSLTLNTGEVITKTGQFYDTLMSSNGSDSVLNIYFTKLELDVSKVEIESCEPMMSPSGLYTWFESGSYTDTLTNINQCDSILMVNFVKCKILSTPEGEWYNVFPNPSTGKIYILTKTEIHLQPSTLRITNATGKTVYQKLLHKGLNTISLLEKGVFILTISNNDHVIISKLINQ